MPKATKGQVRGLAGAAGYLCSAQEELTEAGYSGWSAELQDLIEIITEEIGWLQAGEEAER
ncbi:MAG: hypothetical protein ACREJG_07615 [Candidatus Rokuibacteriota bacterium]